MTDAPVDFSSPRRFLVLALPAIIIGVVSALLLWGIDWVAEALEHWVWSVAPAGFGIDPESPPWIVGILTLTGVTVGLVVWLAPGHGGQDSATVEFIAPVLPLRALPGVVAVLILGLAGGVSLGPEAPIIALNTGIAVWLLARFFPRTGQDFAIMTTAAGTVGAMFGTPVAAALLLTGMVAAAKTGGALWDRMFLPLTAAGAGALTMTFLGGGSLVVNLPDYGPPQLIDLLSGSLIAVACAALAIVAIWIFPRMHALFRRLRHPMIYLPVGGLILGLLGVLGGPLTLFRGLHQMVELVNGRAGFDPSQLLVLALIKLLALVVAASAGFRGGRIFPAVFIGVALGLLANLLVPSVPVSIAVAAGVLGLTLAISRDGWLALFIAVAVTGDITTLPVLCIVVLPTWLIVTKAPEMIVHSPQPEPAA